jgi:DNA-binding MarR family transcriptional regulator
MAAWAVRRRRAGGRKPKAEGGGDRTFVIEESLGYLVNRAARVMAQQLADELRPAGIGIGQWAVLLFLWDRDGLSQAELARVVAIEPPTLVRTLDRMERDGLVERRRDPRDARLSRIYLTKRGRMLRDELVPHALAINARQLGGFSTDERLTLLRLLARMAALD